MLCPAFRDCSEQTEAVRRVAMPTIWLWPNIDAGTDAISHELRRFREVERPSWLRMHRNFTVEDYARLLNAASCIVGNSSSALREGAFLGTPAVNIGSRQPYWRARQPALVLPGADRYYARCLSLPIFPSMETQDVERVASELRKAILPIQTQTFPRGH